MSIDSGRALIALGDTDHALDLSRVGGSDAAAVLGLSPWATPWDVWRRCVFGPEQVDSERMRWGRRLEPVVLAAYEAAEGVRVEPAVSVVDGVLRATPDGLVALPEGRTRLVEAKTTSAPRWAEPPAHYVAQVLLVAAVWQVEEAVIVALHQGSDLAVYPVDLSGAQLVATRVRQWAERHVVPAQDARARGDDPWVYAPPSDALPAPRPRQGRAPARPASEDEARLIGDLAAAQRALDAAKARHELARAALLDAIGEDGALECDAGRVSVSTSERRTPAWSRVVADLRPMLSPDQATALDKITEARTSVSTSRSMRLSGAEGEQ